MTALKVFYASYADSVEYYLEKDVFRNTVIALMEPHHFPKDRFLVLRVMQEALQQSTYTNAFPQA